jgi:hypothetical protein
MGFFGKIFGQENTPMLKSARKHFEIVGEAAFQENLSRLSGGKTEDGVKQEHSAYLILDSNNPNYPNAVRIEIGGKPVGYLSADDALEYRKFVSSPKCGCECIIVGGWDRGADDEGHFGVKLKIAWPPKLVEKN